MRKTRGFTLIELMVTITVLAVLTVMAIPAFGNLAEKQNLNKSTQALVNQLNNARSKAVLERKNITVNLNPTSAQKTVGDGNGDSSTPLIWISQGNAILKSSSPTEITFQLSGGVKDFDVNISGKPFVICNKNGGNKSKNISISLMGTVQVSEGAC